MLAAGLLARTRSKRGLKVKPWVKTSLAPGSQVVTDYYAKAGLAGMISTRSASTSSAMAAPPASAIPGRFPKPIAEAIEEGDLVGRRGALRQPQLRGPHQPARCGRTTSPRRRSSSPMRSPARCESISTTDPLGNDSGRQAGLSARTSGRPTDEIADTVREVAVSREMFRKRYGNCLRGAGGMAQGRASRRA